MNAIIVINASVDEVAALVLAVQGRQEGLRDPLEEISRQADSSQHHSKPEECP